MNYNAKRMVALVLALLAVVALLAACERAGSKTGNTTSPDASTPSGNAQATTRPGESKSAAAFTLPKDKPLDEKKYAQPDKIPTVKQGKDYSDGMIPDGVAEIYSMDGKLLFTYITRLVGDEKTKTNKDFYTLFEYNADGTCTAVSPEVGYIMRIGDGFLYEKSGVGLDDKNYWNVPYFTNNSSWTDEKVITGEQAQQLISAPASAMIKGKMQPYTIARNGANINLTLTESGETLTRKLETKKNFNTETPDGLMIDIKGVANEKIYLAISYVPKEGGYVKELCSLGIENGELTPLRYAGMSIWADPIGGINDGILYGYCIQDNKDRSLVQIDSRTNTVKLLASVKDAAWHCVANDSYVLYEVPKKSGDSKLERIKIAVPTPDA